MTASRKDACMAVVIIESAGHVLNEVRLAFHASNPEDVDRIAGLARGAGACAFGAPQWCRESRNATIRRF